MFLPEYTITNKILRHISSIEYSKALIENTVILQNWENQLKKECLASEISASAVFSGFNVEKENIKKYVDGLATPQHPILKSVTTTSGYVENSTDVYEIDENFIKRLHQLFGLGQNPGIFRKRKVPSATSPEEILAEMVEFTDWYHSLDARETHPIILAGIVKAKLEAVSPFDDYNFIINNLTSKSVLKAHGYNAKGFCSIENWYSKTKWDYERVLFGLKNDQEYTEWLEYFTEGLSNEFANTKERVLLLARNTKLAKSTGRIKLTTRQERIVEYIQDYGLLQNKDFSIVFPGISEDSILRDLKKLIEMGIIVKTGSTKSSRYEIA